MASERRAEASTIDFAADDVSAERYHIGTPSAAFGRMPIERLKEQLQHWLSLSRTSEETSKQVMDLWADRVQIEGLTAEQTLDRLIDSFAMADKSVQQLVESCRSTGTRKSLEFEGARADAFFRDQVTLVSCTLADTASLL